MFVLRCDSPYRQSSPHGTPKPGSAERDREGLRNAVLAMRDLAHGRIFLGGHSYGGRQATTFAGLAPELVAGVVLIFFSLDPPRRLQELRTQEFFQQRTPAPFLYRTLGSVCS